MGLFKKLFGGAQKSRKSNQKSTAAPSRPAYTRSTPPFPEGENHIDDPDIGTVADLGTYYPLPDGFAYRTAEDGSPYVERLADHTKFTFLIEAGLMTFDEPHTLPDGKIHYHTTEIFKKKR